LLRAAGQTKAAALKVVRSPRIELGVYRYHKRVAGHQIRYSD